MVKRKILITSVVVVVLVAGSIVYIFNRNSKKDNKTATSDNPISIDSTNYNPPTEEEKQETEQFKKEQEAKQNANIDSQQSTSATQKSGIANVSITNLQSTSQAATASGFVSNVFEDGGNCTLTLTLGNQKITGTSKGIADVNKTTCPEISIPRSSIPQSGQWTAVLSYASSKISGTSDRKTIEIK